MESSARSMARVGSEPSLARHTRNVPAARRCRARRSRSAARAVSSIPPRGCCVTRPSASATAASSQSSVAANAAASFTAALAATDARYIPDADDWPFDRSPFDPLFVAAPAPPATRSIAWHAGDPSKSLRWHPSANAARCGNAPIPPGLDADPDPPFSAKPGDLAASAAADADASVASNERITEHAPSRTTTAAVPAPHKIPNGARIPRQHRAYAGAMSDHAATASAAGASSPPAANRVARLARSTTSTPAGLGCSTKSSAADNTAFDATPRVASSPARSSETSAAVALPDPGTAAPRRRSAAAAPAAPASSAESPAHPSSAAAASPKVSHGCGRLRDSRGHPFSTRRPTS